MPPKTASRPTSQDPLPETALTEHLEHHLRNLANYRPFRFMSPLEIMSYLEAKGYRPAFIDEAMKRIVTAGGPAPRRKRTSPRQLLKR